MFSLRGACCCRNLAYIHNKRPKHLPSRQTNDVPAHKNTPLISCVLYEGSAFQDFLFSLLVLPCLLNRTKPHSQPVPSEACKMLSYTEKCGALVSYPPTGKFSLMHLYLLKRQSNIHVMITNYSGEGLSLLHRASNNYFQPPPPLGTSTSRIPFRKSSWVSPWRCNYEYSVSATFLT